MESTMVQPYRAPKRLWRISKYLIPCDRSAFNLAGAPAPKQVAFPAELSQRFPDWVQVHPLGDDADPGDVTHWSIYQGKVAERRYPSYGPTANQVVRYQHSSIVGRHSSILGPENTLVADVGYYHPSPKSMRPLPMGRFNPLYWRYMWQGDLRNRQQLPKATRIEGTAAVLNNPWCHNYYHWLLEVVPRIMLLRRAGVEPDWFVLEFQSRYQKRVLELLGIPLDKCIQPHYGQHLKADSFVRPSHPGVSAWKEMASTIKNCLAENDAPGESCEGKRGRRIYISRKAAAHRKLANEAELDRDLAACGFESHSFESIDFSQQVRLMRDAEVIVAVHGAALANLIFARPGTPVIEICPINRYNPDCFPRVSQKMGLRHASVMASSTRFRQQLQVDLSDVRAAFEHLGLESH